MAKNKRIVKWGSEYRTSPKFREGVSCPDVKWSGFCMPFKYLTAKPFESWTKDSYFECMVFKWLGLYSPTIWKLDIKTLAFSNDSDIQMPGIQIPAVVFYWNIPWICRTWFLAQAWTNSGFLLSIQTTFFISSNDGSGPTSLWKGRA